MYFPNINCNYCLEQKRKLGHPPACELPQGCDIGDIAPDIELNKIVTEYLKFKRLNTQAGYAKTQEVLLEKAGLTDEADLLCEFEQIVSDFITFKQKKSENNKKGLKTYGSRR